MQITREEAERILWYFNELGPYAFMCAEDYRLRDKILAAFPDLANQVRSTE